MEGLRSTETWTGPAWERFLIQLSPEPDRAAEKFDALRRRLVDLFRWRGLAGAEDLADETIARAVRQVAAGEEIRTLPGYVCGIANLVALEAARRARRVAPLDEAAVSAHPAEEPIERLDSLDRCLERLPPRTRELVLRYYAGGPARIGGRKRLADELGIGLNALRIRIHRVRVALGVCLGRSSPEGGRAPRVARGSTSLPARLA